MRAVVGGGEPIIRVHRLTKLEHITHKAVWALLHEAIAAMPMVDQAAVTELAARITESALGLFVATEQKRPVCVAAGVLPTSALMMMPQVVLAFNKGRRPAAKACGAALRHWFRSAGYSQALALNLGESRDAVYMRTLRHFGGPRVVGSAVMFEFGEE